MKKVISLGCLGVVLAAATFGSAQAAQQKPVRLASDFTYPPFNYKDASGTPQGFDIEIADALCAEAQLNCEWVTQSWDGLIPSLLALRLNDKKLAAKFNQAIKTIRDNGTYDKIASKYFNFDIYGE